MSRRQKRALIWFGVAFLLVWIIVPLLEALAD